MNNGKDKNLESKISIIHFSCHLNINSNRIVYVALQEILKYFKLITKLLFEFYPFILSEEINNRNKLKSPFS